MDLLTLGGWLADVVGWRRMVGDNGSGHVLEVRTGIREMIGKQEGG